MDGTMSLDMAAYEVVSPQRNCSRYFDLKSLYKFITVHWWC